MATLWECESASLIRKPFLLAGMCFHGNASELHGPIASPRIGPCGPGWPAPLQDWLSPDSLRGPGCAFFTQLHNWPL